jgi:opacity protein-like surface antigen
MKRSIVWILVLLGGTALSVEAQRLPAQAAPKNWVSAYGQMYTNISSVVDPGSSSRWVFDDNALGFGARLHREVGSSLLLGVDASFARPAYERRDLDLGLVVAEGTATIMTAMANGRFAYGGASEVGLYLTGGIGTVAYNLEDLSGWNADLALNAGTGLEWRFQRDKALALEWGRIWAYHEKEDLGGGSQQHSMLRLALRLGF